MDLTVKKLSDARQSGADYLCAGCTYCQIQFDAVQKMISSSRGTNHELPSILYPQLLGLSLGISGDVLGLPLNQLPLGAIEDFYFVPEPEPEPEEGAEEESAAEAAAE